jgi:hypothetical protein
MPSQFSDGMDYASGNANYHVTTGNTYLGYQDCIKISFDSPDDFGPPWEQPILGGTGYFYLVKGVGLVYFHFENRTTHNIETFSLAGAPKQLAMHLIHGHIQNSAGSPLPNVYLSLDTWLGMNWWGKTDAAGNYSFDFYCETGLFHGGFVLGYDTNGNNSLNDSEISISSNYFNFPSSDIDMGTMTI